MESSDKLLSGEQVVVGDPESASPATEKISSTAFRDWVQYFSDASSFENKVVKRAAKALACELQERNEADDSFNIGGYPLRTRPLSGDGNRYCLLLSISLLRTPSKNAFYLFTLY